MHIRTSLAAAFLLVLAASSGGRAEDATIGVKAANTADETKAAKPRRVYLIGNLRVSQPSLDLTAGSESGAGVYLVIDNRGSAPDRLIGGSLDGGGTLAIPPGAEADGFAVPPAGHVVLGPGTAHLLLTDPGGLSPDGPPLRGTLRFEKAGVLHVAFGRTTAEAADEDQTAPIATDKPVNLAQ